MRLEDLPLEAQKKVLQEMNRMQAERKRKFHNKPDSRGVLAFDSQKEARRFDELKILFDAGEISDLRLQPQFTLSEAYTTPDGVRVRPIKYRADFSYKKDGWLIVEDVKSAATKTRVYELKRKLLRERFGIEITEVE
jgi:hypothetical protein